MSPGGSETVFLVLSRTPSMVSGKPAKVTVKNFAATVRSDGNPLIYNTFKFVSS
jgi:hypothetical protein